MINLISTYIIITLNYSKFCDVSVHWISKILDFDKGKVDKISFISNND